MAWMRETRIRMFMQLELKACLDEINWMIRCHNCEVFNCPQEEYPPRPLPIPPDYIDSLRSRLVKVKKGILPPTLKMILKTYYHLPARQALVTSPVVQPDDMMRRHWDGERNPLEAQVSEQEEKVVADGTSSTDKGGNFVSQTGIGMDHEASQVTARHFELAMFRQHQGTTTKSTDWGGHYPIQTDFAGNPETVTTARVAAREEVAIGWYQRGTTSTEQNQQFDPGGSRVNCSFLPSGYGVLLYCMLCCACFSVLPVLQFPILSYQVLKATRLSAEDGSNRDTLSRGAAFELAMGSSRFSIQKGYCCTFTVHR